jgi:hypothetical protein
MHARSLCSTAGVHATLGGGAGRLTAASCIGRGRLAVERGIDGQVGARTVQPGRRPERLG